MLRVWGAPFFALYLALLVSPTLVKLIWPKMRLAAYFTLFICIAFLIVGGSWVFYQATVQRTTVSPSLKKSEYLVEYERVKKLLETQPTHRDLLWNAAILADYVGDSTASAQYRERARQVDPNFSFSN